MGWLRKQLSKFHGFDGGLSKPGPWRVIYPDGKRTRPLQYGECLSLQERYGGTLEYIPEARAKDGVALIVAERKRQVEVEGWTPEHDDEHGEGYLALAAAVYALPPDSRDDDLMGLWPWDRSWWKPGDRIRELVKAGALIAAEIDRLQRREG